MVIERGEVVSPTVIMGIGMPKAGRVPEVRKFSTVACSVGVLGFAFSVAMCDAESWFNALVSESGYTGKRLLAGGARCCRVH